MPIPYGTDAPMRRFPFGTVFLIVLNIVLFKCQDTLVPASVYTLDHGNGIHPIQWLWSGFAHGDGCHLLGNMIFLGIFGVIVESTMKLHHFLIFYSAINIIQNGLEQLIMLSSITSSGSLGASGAIYGLMMAGILCAPNRNVKCIWILYFMFYRIDIPVLIFSMFYFFWDFGFAMFNGFQMSTPTLHAFGAVVGFALGLVAMKCNWFESDGNDLFSLIKEAIHGNPQPRRRKKKGLQPTPAEKLIKESESNPIKRCSQSLEVRVATFNSYLNHGHYDRAAANLLGIERDFPAFKLNEAQLIRLINLGFKSQEWDATMRWIDQYLSRFERISNLVRLQKARLLVTGYQSPVQATKELKKVDYGQLTKEQRDVFKRVRANAVKLWKANPMEVSRDPSE